MINIISLLFIVLLSVSAQAKPSLLCKSLLQDSPKENHISNGILHHGEHLSDLILHEAQNQTNPMEAYKLFQDHTRHLVAIIESGQFENLNEKIDGSPSIVAGFINGKAFVAYKNEMKKIRGPQKLIFSEADAKKHYGDHPLNEIFSGLANALLPQMQKLSSKYHNMVFQGDLLFSTPNDVTQTNEGLSFQPNAINYQVSSSHPLFKRISASKAGVVFHTVGLGSLDHDDKLRINAPGSPEVLDSFIKSTNKGDFFGISPIHQNPLPISGKIESSQVEQSLQKIEELLTSLSDEFRSDFSKTLKRPLSVFFNSGLHPNSPIGLFELVKQGADVETLAPSLISDFKNWYLSKIVNSNSKTYTAENYEALESLSDLYFQELSSLITAFAYAVQLQWGLMEQMPEAFKSQIGNSPSEGFMLNTGQSVVKIVDRMGFTLTNNAVNQRASGATSPSLLESFDPDFADLPHPFKQWRPDALFIIMKGQPFHAGHIEMIKKARALGRPVFILASNKAPNLDADQWKELSLATRKKDLQARNYTYFLPNSLRRQLLAAGLDDDPNLSIHTLQTGWFWNGYLKRAQEKEKEAAITFVVGQKEVDEQRYGRLLEEFAGLFKLLPIELQEGGISATQVRQALKDEDLKVLQSAFSYIESEDERNSIIQKLLTRWQEADSAAQAVLGN